MDTLSERTAREDGQDIVIVSDLHLSAGYDPRTGTYHRNEDFFYDAAFARFLTDLRARAEKEGRTWRLVILGDLFDFLQVPVREPLLAGGGPDAANGATVAKLERIAAGHPEFFEGLGGFVAAGHGLDIVPGNHDIELVRPAVQERFRALVAESGGGGDAAGRIRFHPWILYVPGVLYAEHGHQYDRDNSFATVLEPYAPGGRGEIELPLGSHFVLHFFNRIEAVDPFADNVKPPTRYLRWALRVHPILVLGTLRYYLSFFFTVITRTSHLSAEEQAARRERYRREVLRPYARRLGLPYETLLAIDALAAKPAMGSRWRLLRALVVEPFLPLLPVGGGLLALYAWMRNVRFNVRSLTFFAGGVLGLAWRERRLLRPATQPSGYLHRAALGIDRLLREQGGRVPFYIFGHTHTAEQYPLTMDRGGARYLNTGTWTPVVPADFEILGGRERFTFVQVTRDPDTRAPIARLLFWNDAANRHEPLPLLGVQPLGTLAAEVAERAGAVTGRYGAGR
jgi:UDP-2,3-diacylglucosamine pyrophosphatase LpxH